ncbi:MAG: tetratricopeptide repeat protein [Candidatus Thiodiazotropha sp.]
MQLPRQVNGIYMMKIHNKSVFHIKSFLIAILMAMVLMFSACTDKAASKKNYYDRGMELFEQGNYTKARLEFKNVLQIDPKDADAYYMFGLLEEKEENWQKAFSLYMRATELDPKHIEAQIHLGTIYVLAGEADKALAAADVALQVNPKNSEALVLRGFALAKSGKSDEAITDVLSAIESDPSNVEAASLLSALYADQGDSKRAIKIARESLDRHRDRAASYLLLARLYAQDSQDDEVVKVLKDLITFQPDELQNRLHLVSFYTRKERFPEAEDELRKAVRDLPDSNDAKLALVSFLKTQSKTSDAEALLKQYAAEASENSAFKIELARYYLSQKHFDDALQILSGVITAEGDSADGLAARTLKATALLSQGDNDQASTVIEEVLEKDPKNKEALFIRASLSLVSSDPDKGIADLRTLLREDPAYVKAHRLLARAHMKKGEVELARKSLEDAIKIEPQESAANFELVQLLIKTGELNDAVEVLNKLRRFAPKDLQVLVALATAYTKLERWDDLSEVAYAIETEHADSPLGPYYQGLSYQAKGETEKSITSFNHALELQPSAIEVLVALAKSYFISNQPDQAAHLVERVVKKNPKHFRAINLLGEIYLSQKRLSDAEEAFRQVLAVQDKWPVPYQNLVKVKLAQGKQQEALSILKDGFDTTQEQILGIELANVQDKMGLVDESMQTYQRILDEHPGNVLAANNLVMIMLRGDPDTAKLDQALRLVDGFATSENPIILDTLGWLHVKRGENDDAITVLRKAARLNKDLAEIDYHLAVAYEAKGDKEAAVTHLEKALSSGKKFDGIDDALSLKERLTDR